MNDTNDQAKAQANLMETDAPPQKHGSLCYFHIPAIDVQQSATFYERVFNWKIRQRDTDRPRFDDGNGYVSGAWVTDQAISHEPGLLPYIHVSNIDDTVEQINMQGGKIIAPPILEKDMRVATFSDPAGNILGIFQEGIR